MKEYRNRLILIFIILIFTFFVIAARLWYLQIIRGEEYEQFSKGNRVRVIRIPPHRGRIFDRQGNELVINRSSFDIFIIPKDVDDPIYLDSQLSFILDTEPDEIKDKIDQGLKSNSFKPVLIARDITRDRLAVLEARRINYPGVLIELNNVRKYPYGDLASHLIGYLGRPNESEIKKNPDIFGEQMLGKSGIEKSYDNYLRGIQGYRQKVTDALGREVKSNIFKKDLTFQKSMPGNNLHITIDSNLQKIAEESLGEMSGAVVAVDVRNGDVLAIASKPNFLPEDFIKGIESSKWKKLINDKNYPLLNRATQGAYPPGSVFKIVTASAGLNEKIIDADTTFYCPGYYKIGSRIFRCWKRAGHGTINLYNAIVQSCDVYFYNLAERLGIDRFYEYMKSFGFGEKTGIDIEERKGVSPNREWKRQRFKKPWYKGETIISAIGQGYVSVTPLQIAMMTAAIANGGKLYKPNLVKKVTTFEGETLKEYGPNVKAFLPLSNDMLHLLQESLIGVVNEPGGTGRRARLSEVVVAGKTGTAQVISANTISKLTRHRDHAWFTSFAPAINPEIAVTVLVENGGHGGSVAAPIAKKVLESYFGLTGNEEADELEATIAVVDEVSVENSPETDL